MALGNVDETSILYSSQSSGMCFKHHLFSTGAPALTPYIWDEVSGPYGVRTGMEGPSHFKSTLRLLCAPTLSTRSLQGGSSIAPGTSVGTRKSVSSIEGPHSIPPLFPLRVLYQAPVPSSGLGDCSHPSLQPVPFYPPDPPDIPSLCCLGPALSPSSCFLPSWVCLGTEMLKVALSHCNCALSPVKQGPNFV